MELETENGRILPADKTHNIYVLIDGSNQENGVNWIQTCEGATPVMEPRVEQPSPCRNTTFASTKWTKEMNKIVMKCHIKSSPNRRDIERE